MRIDLQSRKFLLTIFSILLMLVGFLSIAYAALSTTLQIVGNAEVSAASWNVHFSNIQVNSGSVAATTVPVITDNRKINFSVELNEPGDFYKFTVDIVNEGSIDAMIDSIVKTPELTEEQAKYIKYEIEYTDGNSISSMQLLGKELSRTISVLVSYRTDILSSDLPNSATQLDLAFTLICVQADDNYSIIPEKTSTVRLISGDLNTVGSEVAIGNEHFYIIKNNGNSLTMLAKYNLYVGRIVPNGFTGNLIENPTGIQDPTALGTLVDSSVEWIGTIEFSTNVYWPESSSPYADYVYNLNSSVYSHVENYRTYLESLDVVIDEARLISFEELRELGCSTSKCNSAPEWVYGTSYWTGSSFTSEHGRTFGVRVDGAFGGFFSFNHSILGVRPVIKISLAEF